MAIFGEDLPWQFEHESNCTCYVGQSDACFLVSFYVTQILLTFLFLTFQNLFFTGYWPPAQLTRPVRSGGRLTSPWWRSWVSRATTQGRPLEAGCGTAPSPGTPSTLSPVRKAHSSTETIEVRSHILSCHYMAAMLLWGNNKGSEWQHIAGDPIR